MAKSVLDYQEDGMSKLLINESPLQVQPSLAMAIGLNEAIFLQQLHYWLGATRFTRDGKKWVYNTYADWLLQLKYTSESTLKRTIKSLKHQKLIHVEHFEKLRSNQVSFYSIDYEVLAIISENIEQAIDSIDKVKMTQSTRSNCTNALGHIDHIHQVKMTQSPSGQNDPILTREYQENTQEITHKKSKPKFGLKEASSVELPEGVNRELWVGYIEMRFSMNKKPTPKAVELAIKDLANWGAEKANQSLKNSITSNWTGLFEPKQAVQTYVQTKTIHDNKNVNQAWAQTQTHYEAIEQVELEEWMV